MENIVEILKALSDETRLRVINLLYEGELCVCDIMEVLDISQAKASRHLAVLRRAGLVTDRKSAQWVYYTLAQFEKNEFLERIVFDQLRQSDLYATDLKNLLDWLALKNSSGCLKYSNWPERCNDGNNRDPQLKVLPNTKRVATNTR